MNMKKIIVKIEKQWTCNNIVNGVTPAENLAKQLKVTVNAKESYVADGLTVGSKDSYIGVLDVGTGEEFSVTVEFENKNADIEDGVPGSTNDIAQGENVKFDLVVYAIQVVTNTSP